MPPRTRRARACRAGVALAVAAMLVGSSTACTPGGPDDADAPGTAREAPVDEDAAQNPAPGTPLPEYDAASAVGDLADGFPTALVTIPPGAQVLASSARPSPDGTLVLITLNLRSDEPVEALTAFYADALGAVGFGVSPTSVPSALTSLTTFVRTASPEAPTESVAVGVFDDETERLVTISGQVVGA